ncbi:hypothetical protein [Caldimonas tepidiphila]|uniref:hypothetical protein n=1 Tax=Caldimonas tepidiphila TaxID=2315841 RepID=UPI000E5BE0DB|nr:hypothetical protein [Caldimonas tepidiphila]
MGLLIRCLRELRERTREFDEPGPWADAPAAAPSSPGGGTAAPGPVTDVPRSRPEAVLHRPHNEMDFQ